MIDKKVAIIGAGFSGLTLAYSLQKKGIMAEVFEARAAAGGLIQTSYQKVIVEAAAHALLASADVEELFRDLQIELVKAGYVSNAKWIFRQKPKKWPLTLKETWKALGIPRKPLPQETVADWVQRNLSQTLCDYLIAPGLQGVYGAQPDQLSATLIAGGFQDKKLKPKKASLSGSVAPLNGMSELIQKLSQQTMIHYNSSENIESLQKRFSTVVVATSIQDAGKILLPVASEIAYKLSEIPLVSLLSATISFKNKTNRIQGFGCLFPKAEEFESLGVLFNSDIFPKRGQNSETWIFAGDYESLSSQMLLKKILRDRSRLEALDIDVDFCEVHRWPHVLPLYGLKLESLLAQWPEPRPFEAGAKVKNGIYLSGNYLGGIGLAKILSYNKRLAARIEKDLQ